MSNIRNADDTLPLAKTDKDLRYLNEKHPMLPDSEFNLEMYDTLLQVSNLDIRHRRNT